MSKSDKRWFDDFSVTTSTGSAIGDDTGRFVKKEIKLPNSKAAPDGETVIVYYELGSPVKQLTILLEAALFALSNDSIEAEICAFITGDARITKKETIKAFLDKVREVKY